MRRTANEVAPQLAHSKVIRSYMTIHGPSTDVGLPDMEGLDGVACFFERLNGLPVLRPEPRRRLAASLQLCMRVRTSNPTV